MFRRAVLALVIAAGSLACWVGSGRTEDKPQKVPPFVHAVFFFLNKDAPEGETEALIKDAHELLRPIATVRDMRVGRPAGKDSRTFVKKDYAVALVLFFDDVEGLENYIKDPLHLKYVERHGKYLDRDKMMVFDFAEEKK
jgi:hypothetical protein